MLLELMPHQVDAFNRMHNGSILKGGVGTGKTITALMYYYNKVCGGVPHIKGYEAKPMKRPRDIYVITTAKKRDDLDWESEAADFGISRKANQDGVCLHVDSWNNISHYEDVTDAFFIWDEQRLVGSGSWVKSFQKIAANNQWVLLSGTPGDTWMDYVPVFIANGFYKNRTAFIDQHVEFDRFSKYPKIKKYHNVAELERRRASILVEMPFTRHTIRRVADVLVDYDRELFEYATKKRWHVYEERPLKDAGELEIVMRKIVNTDVSRIGEILRIIEKHPKLIIFYNFNYELEMLRTLETTLDYPIAEWNGHKHQPIPDTDKWIYLVQYTAGAEGWNCIETDAIAFWSLNYSWKIFEQSKGRIDRLNTPYKNLHYYVLKSEAPIDKRIWQNLGTKEKFNGKKYAEKLWDLAA